MQSANRPLPVAALFAAARVGLAESKPAGTKNERSAGLVESIAATSAILNGELGTNPAESRVAGASRS